MMKTVLKEETLNSFLSFKANPKFLFSCSDLKLLCINETNVIGIKEQQRTLNDNSFLSPFRVGIVSHLAPLVFLINRKFL